MRGSVPLAVLTLGLASGPMAHAQSPCGGTRFNVQTVAAESRPYVQLTLDGKTGPFLLDFGATASTVARSVWNVPGPEVYLSGLISPASAAAGSGFVTTPHSSARSGPFMG